MARTFLLVLVAFSLLASALAKITLETRKNAVIVENNTHISQDALGNRIVKEPSGKVTIVNAADTKPVQQKKDINGWLTSYWAFGTNFNYFFAEWTVPANPSNSVGQIIYIFNSFEDATESNIIQPVLQWGNPTARWYLASWAVLSNGAAYESTPYPVNPGDQIYGSLSLSGGTWYIYGFVNGAFVTSLSIAASTVGGVQPTAQFTLETYYISDCSQLPATGSVTGNALTIEDNGAIITPTWYLNTYGYDTYCYQSGSTITPTQVTLTFTPY